MLDLQSIFFGQNNLEFTVNDYDIIRKIKRLYHKYQRQAENSCNGIGYVRGQVYYCGNIDEYAKRQYGYNVKSAYITQADLDEGESIFDKEMERISDKINSLIKYIPQFKVEYQGDPRGYTVKLYYNDELIKW